MKKSLLILSVSLALTAMASSSTAMAKPMDKKPQKASEEKAEKQYDKRVKPREQKKAQKGEQKSNDPRFSKHEHELIQDYYYRHRYDSGRRTIPKGLKKKYKRTGELPPGWQKKIQRGEVLPKDIYDYAGDIPYELREELPAGPVGSKIIELEGKVLRIMEGTRMILDVFDIGR